eukprot:SM000007S20851  [mRNA]  locus=s7:564911:566986:- [translate_table: standard]
MALLRRCLEADVAGPGAGGHAAAAGWLELAWRRGFDAAGAAQLDWNVAGTRKWIGTTEAAALLRSFGFRARIVDFRSSYAKSRESTGAEQRQRRAAKSPGRHGREEAEAVLAVGNAAGEHAQRAAAADAIGASGEDSVTAKPTPANPQGGNEDGDSPKDSDGAAEDGAAEEHPGIACSQCQVKPIRGKRFRSTVVPKCNLCERCMLQVLHQESDGDSDGGNGRSKDKSPWRRCQFVRVESPALQFESSHEPLKGAGNEDVSAVDSCNSGANHTRLVEWVWGYFTGAGPDIGADPNAHQQQQHQQAPRDALSQLRQPLHVSNKSPLYFQHQGHSRTIVGIERRRSRPSAPEEFFLLVFDPSQRSEDLARTLKSKSGWQPLIKRGVRTLRKAEYQLLYVDPGLATDNECESLKVLDSALHCY